MPDEVNNFVGYFVNDDVKSNPRIVNQQKYGLLCGKKEICSWP